jgi:hypothetical protein
MSDSSDFIFLPALTANDPYQITAPDQQGNRNYSTKGPNYQTQKLQLSNTSSNGGGETPVKQVQVLMNIRYYFEF